MCHVWEESATDAAAFVREIQRLVPVPRLIKASVDTGSLWEDAMIEGFGVCLCLCVCVCVCGGVIRLYSHCLSSLCVTDKADSTPSIWEDRIIIQTAPCHYWHYICGWVREWRRERGARECGEGSVSVSYKRVSRLTRPVLRRHYASDLSAAFVTSVRTRHEKKLSISPCHYHLCDPSYLHPYFDGRLFTQLQVRLFGAGVNTRHHWVTLDQLVSSMT